VEERVADNRGAGEAFARLCDVMDRLRDPGGCPWDRQQTLSSLRPFLLEEAYEVLEALDSGDVGAHREELGDLVFQVVFQSKVRSEEPGGFDVAAVCHAIADKLTRRHPHVFGPPGDLAAGAPTPQSVTRTWEAIKRGEKAGRPTLGGVPETLPALLKAQRVGEKAGRVGFDWPDLAGVMAKVREEVAELEEAIASRDDAATRHELGDLLFALGQASRFMGHCAEDALREAVARFSTRFGHVERVLRERGRTPETSSMEEMNALWEEAKRVERAGHTGGEKR
jgi:MazG family protein